MITRKIFKHLFVGVLAVYSFMSNADTCPDLKKSSLAWGEVPPPWIVAPGSMDPQGDERARFDEASILLSGYTLGVTCTYEYSLGKYTIYYQTRVSAPGFDLNWYTKPGGYGCSASIEGCQFFPQH